MRILMTMTTFSIVYLLACISHIVYANNDSRDINKANMILKGLYDSKTSCVTGICEITGKMQEKGTTSEEHFKIAFDYSRDFYQLTNVGKGKILYRDGYSYSVLGDLKSEDRSMTRQMSTEQPPPLLCFFDVRCLGFIVPNTIAWKLTYEKLHQKLFGNLSTFIGMKKISGGLVQLNFEEKIKNDPLISSIQRKYWISEKQGFSCVRMEITIPTISLLEEYEISYEEINKIWVPIALKFNKTQQNGKIRSEGYFSINWSSINQSLPETLFSLEDFSNPGAIITSFELGPTEPVSIGVVGNDGIILYNMPSKHSYFRYFLITAGLIMMLIGLGRMGYDRWKRKSQI
jgi:hypothetical protein